MIEFNKVSTQNCFKPVLSKTQFWMTLNCTVGFSFHLQDLNV